MKSNLRLFAAAAVAMGLFSCSKEEISNVEPGLLGNAETYTTISIAMPSGNGDMAMASRAENDPEDGDGEEVGTGNENAFNNIALYFFDSDNVISAKCLGVMELGKGDFKDNTTNNNSYTSTPQQIGITGNNLAVYAVVNGSVPQTGKGTPLSTFLTKTVNRSEAINNDDKGLKQLMMTSRNCGKVSITTENNKEKPAKLTVSVERTAAKINFTSKDKNVYSVTKENEANVKLAEVTITDYRLVNLRNDAYFFRKVGDGKGDNGWTDRGDGVQNGKNYVIDPATKEKTVAAAGNESFWAEWFGDDKAYATNTNAYTTLPTDAKNQLLTYCMENTMLKDAQLNGYTTGIQFKAIYNPEKVTKLVNGVLEEVEYTGGNFYRYENVLYDSKETIKKVNPDLTDGNIDEVVDTYQETTETGKTGAVCYYNYWIKHLDNTANMGIMEFAIVRNNAYKLTIESVSKLGEPTGEIDPEDPDEKEELYLDVTVTILPWVVRNNNINL